MAAGQLKPEEAALIKDFRASGLAQYLVRDPVTGKVKPDYARMQADIEGPSNKNESGGSTVNNPRDLSAVTGNDTLHYDSTTTLSNGVKVPPGDYNLTEVTETRNAGFDVLSQRQKKAQVQVKYLVSADGTKIEVGKTTTSQDKGGSWWDNALNPLSNTFWNQPTIKK